MVSKNNRSLKTINLIQLTLEVFHQGIIGLPTHELFYMTSEYIFTLNLSYGEWKMTKNFLKWIMGPGKRGNWEWNIMRETSIVNWAWNNFSFGRQETRYFVLRKYLIAWSFLHRENHFKYGAQPLHNAFNALEITQMA